jgi:hypothetical protein
MIELTSPRASDTTELTSVRSFAHVTAVEPLHSAYFSATVDAEWSIGGRPNGGYLLAILGRAAMAVSPHAHVLAASAHYLRSPEPGAVLVSAELLRPGHRVGQIRTRMSQHGVDCVEALITVGHLDQAAAPRWDDGLPGIGPATFDDAVRLKGPTPNGIRVGLLEQVDLRLDPTSMGFAGGRPAGRGELWGWLDLPGAERFDPVSLLFAIDAFPPATFDIELTGWVPTLQLTVYVRALPAPGPVRVLQRAGLIHDERVDEACFVWDSAGRLVAQGTQLAGIRLGEAASGSAPRILTRVGS